MGDEDFVETFETKTRFEDLALGAFSTVYEKTVFVILDDLGRETAMNGGRGC